MAQTHRLPVKAQDAGIDNLSGIAIAHKTTVIVGRTNGQQTLPMTFGFKAAGWIEELDRHRRHLSEHFASPFTASTGSALRRP